MSRRDQIRMTPEEIRALLEERKTVILCSIGPRGVPHPMPMWFRLDDDGAIRMTTYARSQKVKNLRRDPRVSLLVEKGERYQDLTGVVFYGTAELCDDTERVLDTLLSVSSRYEDRAAEAAGDAPSLRDAMRSQAAKRVAIRVKPERVVSWSHTKLGGVY